MLTLPTSPTRWHLCDGWLLGLAAALMMLGLVMIASASMDISQSRHGHAFHFVVRHGVFLLMGLAALVVTLSVPLAWWQRSSWVLLFASIALLFLVLIPGVGLEVKGSVRWIDVGPFNVQPSEIAKVFIIIYVADYLVRRLSEVRENWSGFARLGFWVFLITLLLIMEPDYGAFVVLMSAVLGMLFLSGAKLRQFIVIICVAAGAVVLLAVSQPYRVERLVAYLDPWADQFGNGYQLTQALIAFGRGEITGVGIGNSVQKLFYLPEAHTDFVFAILGEELGLTGALLAVGLYVGLVLRGLWIGRMAEAQGQFFPAYLAYGLSILLGIQAFINMGVNTGLLPTKGLTLPLVSYGGSSLVSSCLAVGLLLRVDMERRLAQQAEPHPGREVAYA